MVDKEDVPHALQSYSENFIQVASVLIEAIADLQLLTTLGSDNPGKVREYMCRSDEQVRAMFMLLYPGTRTIH